jgi:TP901 family phage tail tape measure protein
MAIFIPLVTKFDDKGLQGAQRALANFQNFAVDVGRVAAAAISAVAVTSVRDAAKFETTLAQIQGLVGLTAEETNLLEEQARKLGPAFGRSAQESAEALYFITSSGIAAADAGGVLEASLKGAAVGLGEVTTIADLTTSAMNAYRTSGLTATNAVEILAEAVREGKAEPAEMAMALGQLLPIAAEMGVPFQDAAAGVAALSTTGLDASEAVTQLRGILSSLLNPTAEATEELAKYGLSAQDLRDQVREGGLLDVLKMLSTTFEGNDEAIGKVFGNVRALTGVLALTGENAAQVDSIFANLNDGVGVLDEAFAIAAETSEFKFNKAMASSKEILLNIGAELIDRLLPYLEQFQTFMENNGPQIEAVFDTIFGAVEAVAIKLGELADAVMPAIMDLINNEQFQENVQKLGDNFMKIADEVIRFIESDLGQFLLDLTAMTVIGGLQMLNTELERLNSGLYVLNELVSLLSGKGVTKNLEGLFSGGRFIGIDFDALIQDFLNKQSSVTKNPSKRAGGGPVASGSSYLVGELGPELFTPASGGGRITPNDALGGNTYNITVNAGMGTNGAALGAQIVSAIKKFERTSGPVFASA